MRLSKNYFATVDDPEKSSPSNPGILETGIWAGAFWNL